MNRVASANINAAEIDRLVDEVVKRLRRTMPALQAPSNTLRIADRVVTLASLSDQLTDIDTVEVSPQAVITPAVRDELKAMGIQLSVTTQPADSNRRVIAGVASCKQRVDAMLHPAGVEVLHRGEVSDVVTALQAAVAGGSAAMLFCGEPYKATVLAGRCDKTRVANVSTLDDARQALRQVAANMLVIDPSRCNPVVIRQMAELLQTSHTDGS